MEGTGAYGAGLAHHLQTAGVELVEVDRPDRTTRRHRGKSDPVDAEAAARAAQAGRAVGVPKTRGGPTDALRSLRVARRSAVAARAQAQTQMKSLIVTAPDTLRTSLRALGNRELITQCATRRPDRSTATDPATATVLALRALARRHQHLSAEIAELDTEMRLARRTRAGARAGRWGLARTGAVRVARDRRDAPVGSPSMAVTSPHLPTPGRQRRAVLGTVAGLVFFGVCGLVLLGLVSGSIGVGPVLVGAVCALLPVGPVVWAFLWLDRWEPEPPRTLLFAFLWGACVAALTALLINSSAVLIADEVLGQGSGDVLGAAVIAPIVEEAVKGAFVVGLLLFRRREFDGIVDGIVYAGLVAAGFAFTENILYMGRAFAESGGLVGQDGGVLAVLILRGVLSPFAHPLFTSMTGIGVRARRDQPLGCGAGAVRAGRLRLRGAAARAVERVGDAGRRRHLPRRLPLRHGAAVHRR